MAVLPVLIGLLCVATLCTSQCEDVQEIDARGTGEISSPSYEEGKYGSNLDCKYRLKAPTGFRLKITFLDLDIAPSTSCVSDRLEIHDKEEEDIVGVFCGSRVPRPVLSREGEDRLLLVFRTDEATKGGRGFRIRYESASHLGLCSEDEGVCRNRNCYDVTKECDGEDDCGDGTDEEGCDYTIPSVSCGETPIKPDTIFGSPDRMVGGEAAVANSWPWHASVQDVRIEPNGHFCAGTLVSAQWVLSAARCFAQAPDPKSVRVTLGSHKLFEKSKYEQVRTAERIIAYPDLQGDGLKEAGSEDTFALIKLNAPVNFTDGVRPACLPYAHWEERVGWQCYTTGWGEVKGAGYSDELKQSVYNIKSVEHCSHNNDTEICVEFPESGHCQDDTGGPLVCRLAGVWYLLGTTSRAAKENPETGLCSELHSKLIFMRVAHKSDWIRETIDKYS